MKLQTEILHQVPTSLENASYEQLISDMVGNPFLKENAPYFGGTFDPRSGYPIVYSTARRKRPHDQQENGASKKGCPICEGDTTTMWDVAPLSEGHTFINENLYPIVFPFDMDRWSLVTQSERSWKENIQVCGTHLLQWHSTEHEAELHTMPVEDIVVGFQRLAVLEKFLLTQKSPMEAQSNGLRGYVSIVKNYGRRAGASLSHGHFQIMHTNVSPVCLQRDIAFFKRHGKGIARVVVEESPDSLKIKAYENGKVTALVPLFIKRPLESFLCVNDFGKNYLHELGPEEILGFAGAIHEIADCVIASMPNIGREPAYNLIFHTGEIGGLYIEMLPYTQEIAGYENLGFYTCNSNPYESARMYQEHLGPS